MSNIDYCYCQQSGIPFTIADELSNKHHITTNIHPRLANGDSTFFSLLHKDILKMPKSFIAGAIILTLRNNNKLVYLSTYDDWVIPRANAGLCQLSKADLISIYNIVTYATYQRKGYTSQINLSEVCKFHNIKKVIREAILLACGHNPDELTIEDQQLIIKEAERKVVVVTPKPKRMPSMNIEAIIKRIPKILKLVIEQAPKIDTQDYSSNIATIIKIIPNYANLSQENKDRLADVIFQVMFAGITHSIFSIDSVDYKSLKHYADQVSMKSPTHAQMKVAF